MEHDPKDRFGTPEEAFHGAVESHGRNNPVVRIGMYVPTRHQVATLAADDLVSILDRWFFESPTELIPSMEQVRQVREVLTQRPDRRSEAVRELIELCDAWFQPHPQDEDPDD